VAAIGRRDFIASQGCDWNQHHNDVYWGFDDEVFCFASCPLEEFDWDYDPDCDPDCDPRLDGQCSWVDHHCCVWSLKSAMIYGTDFEKLIMVPIGDQQRPRTA